MDAAFAAAITSSSVADGRPYRILYAIVSATKSTERIPKRERKHGKSRHNHNRVRAAGNWMTLTQNHNMTLPALRTVEQGGILCRRFKEEGSKHRTSLVRVHA